METKLLRSSLEFQLRFNQLDQKAIDEHFEVLDEYFRRSQIEILEEILNADCSSYIGDESDCMRFEIENTIKELQNG